MADIRITGNLGIVVYMGKNRQVAECRLQDATIEELRYFLDSVEKRFTQTSSPKPTSSGHTESREGQS